MYTKYILYIIILLLMAYIVDADTIPSCLLLVTMLVSLQLTVF